MGKGRRGEIGKRWREEGKMRRVEGRKEDKRERGNKVRVGRGRKGRIEGKEKEQESKRKNGKKVGRKGYGKGGKKVRR